MRALIVAAAAPAHAALSDELARHGYAIAHAADRAEAEAELVREDALLVLVAGTEDALATCRALAAQDGDPERLLVLVQDADSPPPDPVDAYHAGADDVWTLPADPSALAARVRLAGQYARLQAEHVRVGGEFALLRQALDLTGTGFILTDPRLQDDPIVYANQAFLDMTGYTADEVLGVNCRFLQGPRTEPGKIDQMRSRIAAEQPLTIELVNHRKDGTPFVNEVHISPVRDAHGAVVRFVGVQIDVTRHRSREALFVREQTARAAAESAERRSAFLAEASPQLDASLDLRSTLDSLARLSVPFLGDVCIVDAVQGDEVRRLAAAATDPGIERLVRELPTPYPVAAGDPLARVVASGRPEILPGGSPGIFGPAGERAAGLRTSVAQAAMIVPLRARGRTLGGLAFASLAPERSYGAEDLALAEELARRAALALDNARLYEDLEGVARSLQEGLLPSRLPAVEGLDLAARFRPAGDGSVIGGDFYDVLLHDDGLDLVIGDVTGKGAHAAALTGLVRHTVRTAARYESEPSRVLAVVNEALVAERGRAGRYCTVAMCRARLDGAGGGVRVTTCCAGHPLPLVLRHGGDVDQIGSAGSVLGWVDDPRLADTTATLAPGDALVLYTDGVTEARRVGGDPYGGDRLRALLQAAAGQDATGIAARIERAAARSGGRRDDVAVLVARVR